MRVRALEIDSHHDCFRSVVGLGWVVDDVEEEDGEEVAGGGWKLITAVRSRERSRESVFVCVLLSLFCTRSVVCVNSKLFINDQCFTVFASTLLARGNRR